VTPPFAAASPALLRRPAGTRTTWCVVASGLLLTATFGLLSDGAHHDDDLTHFLMARWARWFPGYLLHLWGRPGFTLPVSLVAWIGSPALGWHLARLLSAVVTAASALLAARLAKCLGLKHPWLAAVFCYLQPLNTLLACTTLTENFAAFYLIAAVVLLHDGRLRQASLLFSLVLVSRHETLVWWPIWVVALAVGGRGRTTPGLRLQAVLLSLWAPAAHNLLFKLAYDRWPVAVFLQPHGSTEYPPTGLLGYLPAALQAIPPAIFGLAILGGVVLARRRVYLPAVLAGAFFLTHLLIKALGVFASGGYGRFMVAVAPLAAVLAAAGAAELRARLRELRPATGCWLTLAGVWLLGLLAFELERRAGRIPLPDGPLLLLVRGVAAGMAAILLLAAVAGRRRLGRATAGGALVLLAAATLAQGVLLVRPLRLGPGPARVREAADWLRAAGLADGPIFAVNPWFAYYLDLVENPRAHKGPRLLASMPVGTVFVWDSTYGPSDFHRLPLDRYLADPAYRPLRRFGPPPDRVGGPELVLLQKTQPTPLPPDDTMPYPPNPMAELRPVEGVFYLRPGG